MTLETFLMSVITAALTGAIVVSLVSLARNEEPRIKDLDKD